jgi:uncharacterized repeat protein (TIGR01451 family)
MLIPPVNNNYPRLATKEYSQASYRPRLEIIYCPPQVEVTFTPQATPEPPTYVDPGQQDVVMKRFSLHTTTSGETATWTDLRLDQTGSGVSLEIDVALIEIYYDADTSGNLSAGDELIGSGTFNEEAQCLITLTTAQTIENTAKDYLIVFDFSAHASCGDRVGFSISAYGYITITPPGGITAFTSTSEETTIRGESFSAVADSWIYQAAGDANHGDEGGMLIHNENGYHRYGLVRFDLSTIPSGATIEYAKLKICYYGQGDTGSIPSDGGNPSAPSGQSFDLNIHVINESWNEVDPNGVDWNSIPSYNSTIDDTISTSASGITWLYFDDIQSTVQSWVDSGNNYGWMIIQTGGSSYPWLATREHRFTNWCPRLEIIYDVTAHISLTKSASISPPAGMSGPVPGATINYTIDYTNNGAGTAANLIISDEIPANATYVNGSMGVPVGPAAECEISDDNGANWYPDGTTGLGTITHIRWRFTSNIDAGTSGQLSFSIYID